MAVNLIANIATTLSASYTAGGGSLTLTSVTGLPSGACDFYLAVLPEGANTYEVFHCTNVNAGTRVLTVVGAQDNTGASNHASTASTLAGIVTVELLTQLQTPQVQTTFAGPNPAARAQNTVYQNTGPNSMFVSVYITTAVSQVIQGLTDSANPPTTVVAGSFYSSATSWTLNFWVMSGNFYKMGAAGANTINQWTEWQ
jgi:hypothetical protein